ncbi:ATP-binding protein [uncultured Deinococcus sp.]|uniref:ATP-binding protein n=1 Tax=uncultured Deinococcus sp. TaxID=158789 RepID=UPI0025CE380C|nr:ATP-binding protein [uncultured Deinococcus sp.]
MPLPNAELSARNHTLMGFQTRYDRVRRQLNLLIHLSDLPRWSQQHHGRQLKICDFVDDQYPLVIFHGDVGTGKTVTAEGIANQLIEDDRDADDSLLYKLSTRVRGAGKVGEMGTLINQAFDQMIRAAKHRRAILVIDEGDSLAAARTQDHSHHEDKVAVNTLIQRIDELKQYKGRILVILCTNRLSALDPAVVRRAAVIETFERPSDGERRDLFVQDLADLGLNTDTLAALVDATGGAGQHGVPWTYSDIRSRLYPAALAQAYPDNGLTAEHLLQVALTLKPSPVLEDDA